MTAVSSSTGQQTRSGRSPLRGAGPIVLVGHPNVGKSVLFGKLTGRYVTVCNYPGTTVEIARGRCRIDGHDRPLIDTPGVHGIVAQSDDERVTRDVLLDHDDATVVVVVDTKNLQRGLVLALELGEAGVPCVLNLNMADEAAARGVQVDELGLSVLLGVPVVSTIATRGAGVDELRRQVEAARPAAGRVEYDACVEEAIERIEALLPPMALSGRSIALLCLAGDDDLTRRLGIEAADQAVVNSITAETEAQLGQPVACAISQARLQRAATIHHAVVKVRPVRRPVAQIAAHWASHPIVGWPILAAVLYATYQFVGVFGAGTLVDLIETDLFGRLINPAATSFVEWLVPFELVRAFFVGEYGLITMGLTYGLAIVLPIVGSFFLLFSILEDTGYLPRLAVMLDRVFRFMGLNGKAVLPMILGLGCDTMATMTTRILDTRKQRLQVTLLLALGVPCSAQLGVILGMIAGLGAAATALWFAVIASTLLLVGFVAARVIPGSRGDFILELPPMRMPSLSNIVFKTLARMEWYLKEVLPVFLLGTAALFFLDRTGILAAAARGASPLIEGWLGLPQDVTGAFLIGFLRRDYGAAGLFALAREGALGPQQIFVSLVVITLFIPCIAHLLIIVREHGAKAAAGVVAFVFPFAFLVGGLLNLALPWLGIFASR